MKIGFTGTRNGMTVAQRDALLNVLLDLGADEFHHGDCVGADAEAHQMATNLGCRVVIHPPTDERNRAFCHSRRILPPEPYPDRNRSIVAASEAMVATPGEDHEKLRSGTWSTVRYALDLDKTIVIIYPSGKIVKEVPDEPA